MPEVHLVVGCRRDPPQPRRLRASAASPGSATVPRSRSGTCCAPPRSRSSSRSTLGGLLVFTNHEAPDGLHYLYGILPLLVSFLAEGARTGAAQRELGETDFESLDADTQQSIALQIVRREMGIMAVSCGVILFLALRAAGTSGHLSSSAGCRP